MVVGTYESDVARFETRAILGVRGDVDAGTHSDFERDVRSLLVAPCAEVLIDLNYCTFMDSTGIAALERLRDEAGAVSIRLRLSSVPRTVANALRAAGLSEAFELDGRPRRSSRRTAVR